MKKVVLVLAIMLLVSLAVGVEIGFDPAVVAVDDRGKFAVSLLSGHLGGANALTREVADILGATPVITTATDGAGCFSVDLWAQAQGLAILGLPAAKMISAALLAGRPVGFHSDFPVAGGLPRGFVRAEGGEVGVCVTAGRNAPFDTTLRLVPPAVSLGVGCRKGVSAGAIAGALLKRPASARDMWRLRENAQHASEKLARFLNAVIPSLYEAAH